VSKRTTNRRPRARVLHQAPPHTLTAPSAFPAPQPEFNFTKQVEPESSGVEDQVRVILDLIPLSHVIVVFSLSNRWIGSGINSPC
jgi:hypothetical protein